ncbi:MAG: DUF1570 domain-containing protein [Candidatus Brocadiia bacterium]
MKILPSPARRRRLAAYVAVLAAVFGVYIWRTWWWPGLTVRTRHYVIQSTATRVHTEAAGRALEALHEAYMDLFETLPAVQQPHAPLKARLYGERAEFRRHNPNVGWAEAFYRGGICHAYYDRLKGNPYHWLLHEATHQLNHEVAGLEPPTWIDEGLATYFGASRYTNGMLNPGQPDLDAYPVWWVASLRLSGDVDADARAGEIIPLRIIVTGRGGPDIDREFNLYYVHWWSLTHFLLESDEGRLRDRYFRVIREGGALKAFEQNIGAVEQVQSQWYDHLRKLRQAALSAPVRQPDGT